MILLLSSGRVVFEHEWEQLLGDVRFFLNSTRSSSNNVLAQGSTRFGGLITTIQTLAKQSLSMLVSYIEFGESAFLSIESKTNSKAT